ncbi:Predicted house-cleaning noncanonical NTP pyrophosphatase, all-alpha NTP-PPase (MazG) superfamily [Lactobacillus bombicola]|uniref:Predicted house-cleaning noncanonical NTP pyrophosphatase, all-alpha NTP-PPase (MazG) superfamily n=1 Tax=Lactobacillus bombicola TaxID=1505723 RepID=A0A1I1S4Z8_9LACO|nr:nucleoside triphosphate pyrophosphohydrolase [Lactobacillus bombicola]SFD41595.1 Predicted house-cleaning noncanonical NTP pyrophosphatase, all-alpha NTP-PPase (MazG) superfamily [Lactobacillus bombicola]
MKKLVRDKIPEFVENAKFRKLADSEREPALRKKLIEETMEVIEADSATNLIEELGDVYEVILTYLKFKGVDQATFLKQVEKKRTLKGSFAEFLEMEQGENDNQ